MLQGQSSRIHHTACNICRLVKVRGRVGEQVGEQAGDEKMVMERGERMKV